MPINSSDYLKNNDIAICIVSVSQENEDRVIEKIKLYSNDKIEVFSIFPASKYSLPVYTNWIIKWLIGGKQN